MPFELGSIPDHVIIQAISSLWNNKALSYVGSTLILDNMYFKSSLHTDFKNVPDNSKINIWINSTLGILNISNNNCQIDCLEIYNVTGKKLLTKNTPGNSMDISMLPKGIYIANINTSGFNLKYKIMK
jgi:hypothetical protein